MPAKGKKLSAAHLKKLHSPVAKAKRKKALAATCRGVNIRKKMPGLCAWAMGKKRKGKRKSKK